MNGTLQEYILDAIKSVLEKYPDSWLVWCDPQGDWLPLIQRVRDTAGKKSFTLHILDERTAKTFGSLQSRKQLQEWIGAGSSFVLYVKARSNELGWLHAQALLAETIQDQTLRQKLREWGWRPQNINTNDEDIARLARKNLQLPLDEWGGGQVMPEPDKLLEVLAGSPLPWLQEADQKKTGPEDGNSIIGDLQDERIVLELTVDSIGLPPIDEQNLERWRLEALAHLLVTQAHDITPQYFTNHDYLITPDKRDNALKLIFRWIDSNRLSKGLSERVINADRILGLGNYFTGTKLDSRPYLSQALERALFANMCRDLTQNSEGRTLLETFAPLYPHFENHAHQGFWGDENTNSTHPQSLPWGELARLSKAVKEMLDAVPNSSWSNWAQMVNWYSQNGWRVDRAGEEIMRQIKKPTQELLKFIPSLRQTYAHHWEGYMLTWSHLWQQAGYPIPDYVSQGTWLKEQLKKEARPTAIIMLDALRYDIAMVLREKVNVREGEVERATVTPARTALPSITAIGMGMALPIDENELVADLVNSKWQVYQQGGKLNLSIAENRREWLRTHLKIAPAALLQMDAKGLMNFPKAEGNKARLVIFDDAIDKLGHDEELEPLGTMLVQDRYLQTIEQLRDKGWKRILIVTDHGFIHWPDIREQRASLPLPDPAYTSRRALAYPTSLQWEGPQALAPGGKWRIAVPNGDECFRSYGGLGYFHGGASLQEWIVPCIEIKWPVSAKPIDIRIQPIDKLLSKRPKITLVTQHEELFIENEFPREIEIVIRTLEQKTIFRSKPTPIKPNEHEISIGVIAVDGAEADRNTPLLIELRDIHTNEVFDTQPTILMVDIENW